MPIHLFGDKLPCLQVILSLESVGGWMDKLEIKLNSVPNAPSLTLGWAWQHQKLYPNDIPSLIQYSESKVRMAWK